MELSPEDQEKCAIITTQGLFQPTRMPQGLCNALATFQRLMDHVLADLKFSCVLVYQDDINVFSQTFTDHLFHIEEVYKRLIEQTLNLSQRNARFSRNR